MKVKVLLFASLKDLTGEKELTIELEDGSTVNSLFGMVESLYPKIKPMKNSVRVALNQEFADGKDIIPDGAEVAFLPPVSGG